MSTRRQGWHSKSLPAAMLAIMFALFVLPQQLTRAAAEHDAEREFLCVYADHLRDAADQWVNYRNETGWNARAIAVSAVIDPDAWESSRDQNAAAKELQSFIQSEFAEARSERGIKGGWFAVLLLGDVHLPRTDNSETVYPIPTFYFDKPDDWTLHFDWEPDDYVTDHPYQLADDRDQLPDFLLGRIPAQTNDEALDLLARIKTYEQHPAPGEWRNRITYLASEGGFGAIDKLLEKMFLSLVESAVPYDFDVSMTYANPTSPYCAPPSRFNDYVYQRVNEGALLVNYIGHGAPNMLDWLQWGDAYYPICSQHELDAKLEIPHGKSPIVLIVACSTAMFDRADHETGEGKRSLAESMIFHPNGPIAVIGGSRVTHPYPNAFYQKDFAQQMCIERRATLGGVDLMATRNLIDIQGDTEDQQFERLASMVAAASNDWITPPAALRLLHASLYNLLGDPATAIAYPPGQIVGLQFDEESRTLTGLVEGVGADGDLIATVVAPRSVIARADELIPITGRDDPDLEAKAAHNYEIANDRVLDRVTGSTDPATGEFAITIPSGSLADAPADTLWLKVSFISKDDGTLEAVGSVAVRVADSAEE